MLTIKKNEAFLVENIMENNYESKDKEPPCHSEDDQIKDLQPTLN